MKFYALILCENVTLEKSGADLAAALFLSSRAGRERNLRAMVRGDYRNECALREP